MIKDLIDLKWWLAYAKWVRLGHHESIFRTVLAFIIGFNNINIILSRNFDQFEEYNVV
jgi:hypothetical protein